MHHRGLLGTLLAISLVLIGAALGGIVVAATTDAIGVDALADLLGALLLGGVAGLFAGITLARTLTLEALQRTTAVAVFVAGALVIIGVVRAMGSGPSS